MLAEVLEQRGYPVVLLNGSMNLEERKSAQRAFANEAQILISTDAGGEGLNLQFCHVIINYDLPWNPMKLEQRIGRVDRIGQTHVVRALNFAPKTPLSCGCGRCWRKSWSGSCRSSASTSSLMSSIQKRTVSTSSSSM